MKIYLSPREKEILALVAEGKTNPEIALQLHLTVATIKFHLYNIAGKLNLRRRVLLARWWWEQEQDNAQL